MIPSAVVIPDSRELVEKLIAYLAPAITEVRFPEQAPVPGSGNGGHPDEGVGPYTSRLRYILTDARADGSQIITVPLLDGTHEDVSEEIRQRFYKALVADQVPGIFASRVAAKAHGQYATSSRRGRSTTQWRHWQRSTGSSHRIERRNSPRGHRAWRDKRRC